MRGVCCTGEIEGNCPILAAIHLYPHITIYSPNDNIGLTVLYKGIHRIAKSSGNHTTNHPSTDISRNSYPFCGPIRTRLPASHNWIVDYIKGTKTIRYTQRRKLMHIPFSIQFVRPRANVTARQANKVV